MIITHNAAHPKHHKGIEPRGIEFEGRVSTRGEGRVRSVTVGEVDEERAGFRLGEHVRGFFGCYI